jgi:Protein of unknown function (DUF2752)
MSRSSAPTSSQSVLDARSAPRVRVARADAADRTLAITLLGLAIPWLIYTRLYFFLQPRHLTLDGGFFMTYFKKPDPFCGMTRTFAWMWRGDVLHAVSVYPLGPLIFVATFALVAYSAVVLLSGRALRLTLTPTRIWTIVAFCAVALGLNWASKLIWLGM